MVMDSGMPSRLVVQDTFMFSLCFSPVAEGKQFKQLSTWLAPWDADGCVCYFQLTQSLEFSKM